MTAFGICDVTALASKHLGADNESNSTLVALIAGLGEGNSREDRGDGIFRNE